jgi:hypothetical protein
MSPTATREVRDAAARIDRFAVNAVVAAARRYAAFTHGNLAGDAYRRREEARDQLLDALSQLDSARGVR